MHCVRYSLICDEVDKHCKTMGYTNVVTCFLKCIVCMHLSIYITNIIVDVWILLFILYKYMHLIHLLSIHTWVISIGKEEINISYISVIETKDLCNISKYSNGYHNGKE